MFTPHCLCLSEQTLKAGGPFYLVCMPGEAIDPTQGNGKPVMDSPSQYLISYSQNQNNQFIVARWLWTFIEEQEHAIVCLR